METGQVVGMSKTATGTPAAFCRVVTGGTFTIDYNNVSKPGIGGQLHARKGTSGIKLSVSCVGVAKADLALWYPTTLGVQVASFPDILVECVGNRKWVLSDGQPSTSKLACGNGADAEVEASLDMVFATATPAASAAASAVYNTFKGHTINDCVVTGVTNVMSWELANDLGVEMHNPMVAKSAGSKTLPDGYVVTKNEPKFSFVTSDPLALNSSDLALADDHTQVTIVAALANGTAAEDITITMTNWIPTGGASLPLEAGGVIGYAYDYVPGDGNSYGRVVFS